MKKKYLLTKYKIKIPDHINVIYISNKKIIILSNLITQKLLKLNVQILVNKLKKTVYISQVLFSKLVNKQKQLAASYQGTETALVKQNILELFTIFYQKLKLVGVGYRVFNINSFKNQILLFKLGYSHFLYFKIVDNITVFNSKTIKLFLFGKNYQNLRQMLFLIRSFKKPEPYKGKGILYDTEKILLKKIKKN
jgi:ribosomal protein L6P/L9E